MSKESSGKKYENEGVDEKNGHVIDHNEVWQDGAVLVDQGQPEWAAYFTAFTQQLVPTDDRGNPAKDGHEIDTGDEGRLAGG
jgi:uncharacterized protein YukJ